MPLGGGIANPYVIGSNCTLCQVQPGTTCQNQSFTDGSGARGACDQFGSMHTAGDAAGMASLVYRAIANSEGDAGICRIATAVSPERQDWPPDQGIDCRTFGYPNVGGGP